MKFLKNKLLHVLLIMIMVVGLVPLNQVSANGDAKISYNLNSKQMPIISYYSGTDLAKDISTPVKELMVPGDSYSMFFFIDESVVNIETEKSYVMIDEKRYTFGTKGIIWNDEGIIIDSKKYTVLAIDLEDIFGRDKVEVGTYKNIEAHLHYRDFSIQARKNLIGENQEEIKNELNNKPAEYILYNEDQSIKMSGTATDENVLWNVEEGNQNLVSEDRKGIQNLPDGQYTILETNAGANLETLTGSTSSWLNASALKEENNNKYYSFEVNEDTIDEWMYPSNFDGVSNQLIFDFNSSEKAPVVPDVPEAPEVPNDPVVPELPELPEIPEGPNDSIIPDVPTTPIVPVTPVIPTTPVVTQPLVRDDIEDNDVITEIEDNDTPLTNAPTDTIQDEEIPLSKGIESGEWALMNLICTIATVVIAIVVLFIKNKKEETEQNYSNYRWAKILSVIVALGSIFLFVFTEDMTLTMVNFDKWTIVMSVILIAQIIVAIVAKKSNHDDSNMETSYNS